MAKFKIMIARFPYGHNEHDDLLDYVTDLYHEIASDSRFEVIRWKIADTPITMGRNRCLEVAKKTGCDYVLMIDSDMAPDLYMGRYREPKLPSAKPFWSSSIDFMLKKRDTGELCVVGAPYCGPPPDELVYVFHWRSHQSGHPNQDLHLEMIPREHAAILSGIQEVAALPTGLILMDMRGVMKLDPPYFDYQWVGDGPDCSHCGQPKPGVRADKASTEDVVFTRDLAMIGVKQYCNWDAWAGHYKIKRVGKPIPYTVDGVNLKLREAIVANRSGSDVALEIPEGGVTLK
jgi:hypothetical protein